MKLEVILGSKNRVRVLRTLYIQDSVCGREVSRLADLSPSAANVALAELVECGVVFRSGTPGKHIYELNRGHFLMRILQNLFTAEKNMVSQVADMVRRHVNGLRPRSELLGVGIKGDEVIVALRPLPAPGEPLLRTMDNALRHEFGLALGPLGSDLSALKHAEAVRLPHSVSAPSLTAASTRESALHFFGLPTKPDHAGTFRR